MALAWRAETEQEETAARRGLSGAWGRNDFAGAS